MTAEIIDFPGGHKKNSPDVQVEVKTKVTIDQIDTREQAMTFISQSKREDEVSIKITAQRLKTEALFAIATYENDINYKWLNGYKKIIEIVDIYFS